ncbi:MAG: alpha/beta fold hydrolase [Allomuricauda sp.]
MKNEQLKILNKKGHLLNARLELPASQKPNHYAIFAHCFTCSSNLNAVKNISRALTNHGFGVLRFDFTGLGQGEGTFAESHFSANVTDLIDVHKYMKEKYAAPSLLVGHSLGGAAVITAGPQLKEVKAIATIGAPSTVQHVKRLFSHPFDEIDAKGSVKVNIGGRPFAINKDFVDNFEKTDLPTIVKELRKPLLILHAPFDTIVGIENAHDLFINAMHPKSFVTLDDADHLLTKQEHSLYAGDVIGSWVKKYIPDEDNTILETNGEQLVAHLNILEDNFTTSIQTQKHSFIADEPVSVGGNDFGPAPYELLNASLAACTVMTLKLYAQRKNWDLQEVYVYLTHSKKHIQDMELNGSSTSNYLDHISKKLQFVGELTVEQKARLKEISSRCPVHRTLTGEVIIETSMVE